ncbi:MAG: orotidine-5'-phosphate decarboxylase [Gammaproteobacteria bacterium]|jgi:orotidine-5'-phosphate decarboxylase
MKSPIIVALDYPELDMATGMLDRLDPDMTRVKVGKEMFTRFGPAMVEACMQRGFEVFLDLKFHDIPNTVAGACRSAADLGVWMMNVHASGGRRMMEAAAGAIKASGSSAKLIAVTILTSLSQEEIAEIGYSGTPEDNVSRLARLAKESGLDGIVCSPREAERIRGELGPDFELVTPGVRPAGSDTGDQRRVMTPRDALDAGATYLVIGRPITGAPDPQKALEEILASIG